MSLHMVHFWQERTKDAYGDVVRLEAEVAELKAEVARLRSSSFTTAVPSEEYEKMKAEVDIVRKDRDLLFASHKVALEYIRRLHWERDAAKGGQS